MLYNYLFPLSEEFQVLNLFKYITFRSGGALLTALFLSFILGPYTIRKMTQLQNGGQPIRELGPESHQAKKGTPTMGGIFIIASVVISTILWADLYNVYIWLVLFVFLSFGFLGFLDDYLKISKKNSDGVSGKSKLMVQFIVSFIVIYFINNLYQNDLANHLAVPFFKDILIDLGVFYFVFAAFVIVGASNAVNLTDGLDGLAIGPIMITASCFALIAYLIGNSVFANYLKIHHVVGTGELAVISSSIVGAGLGFLWFNAKPAQIFMGDVGSLSLGGVIGTIAVITKHEIVLGIIGGLFVIEALSVILQVYYFKLSGGKRLFLMAPIHHHFEKKGWSETTVVIRFWIISIIFALIGLSTLKIR